MEQSKQGSGSLPGRGWLGARTSWSHPERGFRHLRATTGESTLLQKGKQGDLGASNLQPVGFAKILVFNLTGERGEDAEGALALPSPQDLVKPAGNRQEAAWADKAARAGGGFGEVTQPQAAELK